MNILIPYSWLKDYLISSVNPKKLAECLSLCGPSVEEVKKVGDDYVYDIEVTTNRVDMMSVLGIAREAAAILPEFGYKTRLKKDAYSKNSKLQITNSKKLNLDIQIKDKSLCPRSAAIILDNVNVKPSPKKIQDRLVKSGFRSLNNIIDISNYLMRELGQPVHTFDYDKIKDHKMIMREAKKGEKIITLDNKTHQLLSGEIVIEDGDGKLIDVCGLMGGKNSAIDNQTKRVLLFVQTYEPQHIRRASMSLGIRTEAAQLFEKQIDPELVLPTINQGVDMVKKLAGGQVASKLIDIYPEPIKPKKFSISLDLIQKRLGIEIGTKKISQILNRLGFEPELKSKNSQVKITVPSWRHEDIAIPEDIVEEVARIYGYHRLPSQLMTGEIPTNYPDENFDLEHQIKQHLAGWGAVEIYSNSLISQHLAEQSGCKLSDHLKIKNALSEEWQYMRRSLILSHLDALANNSSQKQLTFFEMAHVYQPKTGHLPEEILQLVITTNQDYLALKGLVEALAKKLHLDIRFEPTDEKNPIWLRGKTALIKIQAKQIGLIGQIKGFACSATLDVKKLINLSRRYPHYQAPSEYPAIIEDLTFTLPVQTYVAPVMGKIQSLNKLIRQVSLTKKYEHNYTFRLTYQSSQKPLENKDIAPVRKKIVQTLEKSFASSLVGQV